MTPMTDIPNFHGYDIDAIDEVAKELLHTLAEMQVPVPLALMAACRVITVIGTQEDLDKACSHIDNLAEVPFDDPDYDDIDSEDEESQENE